MCIPMILIAVYCHQIPNGKLPSSLSSIANGSFARPSSEQIWSRIYGRMVALHPELAAIPPLTYPQKGQLADQIQALNKGPSFNVADGDDQEPLTYLHDSHEGEELSVVVVAEEHSRREKLRRGSAKSQEGSVILHDPSCSLLSVRLPPIDEGRISPSGRKALQKLRQEINFCN